MNDSSLSGPQPSAGAENLHTLPEIAEATGIPLDDLKHYRREYALRIPIAGSEGTRRYPEAAVETFRTIHGEQSDKGNGGNGGNGGATIHGRRLLSLSAQRQAEAPVAEPEAPARTGNVAEKETFAGTETGGTETGGTSEAVHDPGPPSAFEELSSALALLAPAPPGSKPVNAESETDRAAENLPVNGRPAEERSTAGRRDEVRRTNGATRPRTADDAAPAPRSVRWSEARPAAAPRADAEAPTPRALGMPPRPPRRPTPPPQRPRSAETATDAGADAAARFLGLGFQADAAEADSPPSATETWDEIGADTASLTSDTPTPALPTPALPTPALPLPARESRPTRPIYTLQQIHELTSIPYAKLSLFAARHFDDIPWVGERYSPAYTRQGLEAFCQLYAAENPDWEVPDLGPERGWDDLGGLAGRITALASAQSALGDVLEQAVEEFLRPWTGQAQWEV